MTDLRAAREQAFWPIWRRWGHEPKVFAATLLDDLDRIDREHAERAPVRVLGHFVTRDEVAAYVEQEGGPAGATDEQIEQWFKANPPLIDRVMASLPPIEALAGELPSALAAKPPARRRTTRKAD